MKRSLEVFLSYATNPLGRRLFVGMALALTPRERISLNADWRFMKYASHEEADDLNHVRFSLDGPGEIVATDNGDPTSFESFQSRELNAFNGLCLAIVRAKPDRAQAITLKARSEGLEGAAVVLGREAAD